MFYDHGLKREKKKEWRKREDLILKLTDGFSKIPVKSPTNLCGCVLSAN